MVYNYVNSDFNFFFKFLYKYYIYNTWVIWVIWEGKKTVQMEINILKKWLSYN